MTTAYKDLQEAVKIIEQAQAVARKVGKDAINEGAGDLFKKHPKLQQFGWRQYTPYFNDGDPCSFSAHNYDIDEMSVVYDGYTFSSYDEPTDDDGEPITTHPELEGAGYGWDRPRRTAWCKEELPEGAQDAREEPNNRWSYVNEDFHPVLGPVAADIIEFSTAFPDDILQGVLGDHVEVLFRRDGSVDIEEYHHD